MELSVENLADYFAENYHRTHCVHCLNKNRVIIPADEYAPEHSVCDDCEFVFDETAQTGEITGFCDDN